MYRIYTSKSIEPYNFEFNTKAQAKQFAIDILGLKKFTIAK